MTVELAAAWAANGFQVCIVVFSPTTAMDYKIADNVEIIHADIYWTSTGIWSTFKSVIRRTCMLRKLLIGWDPNVVVSMTEQANVRILAAAVGTGIPVVVSERTDPRAHRLHPILRYIRVILYQFASFVVVQTSSVAEWAKTFLPSRKVKVIPNFVRDLCPSEGGFREQIVLGVGRFSYEKGFDDLLRAFALSKVAELGYKLVLVGDGPEKDALLSLANELSVGDSLVMPGFMVDPESWMAKAEIFVLPSRFEGFPNALIEAMSIGCAAIAFDCRSGPGEIIQDRVNGVLVSTGDIAALGAAISWLAHDAVLRARLGQQATHVRDTFSKSVVLTEWSNCFALLKKASIHTNVNWR